MSAAPRVVVRATLSRCEHGQPLVEVHAAPWLVDVHMRPLQIERLAQHLLLVAKAAKQHEGKHPTTMVLS